MNSLEAPYKCLDQRRRKQFGTMLNAGLKDTTRYQHMIIGFDAMVIEEIILGSCKTIEAGKQCRWSVVLECCIRPGRGGDHEGPLYGSKSPLTCRYKRLFGALLDVGLSNDRTQASKTREDIVQQGYQGTCAKPLSLTVVSSYRT